MKDEFLNNINTNICLYGSPGTGKTTILESLAESLDRPIKIFLAPSIQGNMNEVFYGT